MADNNKITTLQNRAAACINELLEICRDISEFVMPVFSQPEIFSLQCRIQIKRLEAVNGELERIQAALAAALFEAQENASKNGKKDPAADEQLGSARITLQIITQNLTVSRQKIILLQEMLISSGQAQETSAAAKKLADTAQILELQKSLRQAMKK